MGRLTTHVLDTARGRPAEGVRIELYSAGRRIAAAVTDADGRCGSPLLEGAAFVAGDYELLFHAGDYFATAGAGTQPRFLDRIPIRFIVTDAAAHYHVPLLMTPWSYATYRGS